MQLITSQPQFSKTVLRHLHCITWSGHSVCGVLAATLGVCVRVRGSGVWEAAFSGRSPGKPHAQGAPRPMDTQAGVDQSSFPLHRLSHSVAKLSLPLFFSCIHSTNIHCTSVMSKELHWELEKHETEMFPGSTGTNSIREDSYTLSQAIAQLPFWQVLLRRNGRLYTQRHWHPGSSRRSSGKGWRQGWEARVGNRVPERTFQAVGPEPQPCGRKNQGKAAGGSLRVGKGQATLTCSVLLWILGFILRTVRTRWRVLNVPACQWALWLCRWNESRAVRAQGGSGRALPSDSGAGWEQCPGNRAHKAGRRTTSDEGSVLQDLRTLTSRTPDLTNLKILTALTTYSCLLS